MFDKLMYSTDKKLENFTKYVRRQTLARFMVYYELFKRQLIVKESVVERGAYSGGGVMVWPGETMTMLESLNIKNCKIESFPYGSNISFIQLLEL
jgi:hypothetical protein